MKTKINLWKYILLLALITICILKIDTIFSGINVIWNACNVVIFGAMTAYVINLPMSLIENKLNFIKKGKRAISLLLALTLVGLIIYLLIILVVPSLTNAVNVLIKTLPTYLDTFQINVGDALGKSSNIASMDIDWENIVKSAIDAISSGKTEFLGSTIDIISKIVDSIFNVIMILILAIYFLIDKERFIRLYHRLTKLYVPEIWLHRINHALNIVDDSFSAFIGGQLIEAAILGTLCTIGMWIFDFPYPALIGTLVGTINIIPIVGAYVGGGIGMFLVFTVDPIQSIWFLIYLVILQQIESNLIYPKVVGNKVGLPGIYVMITVIVFGSLAGIPGMLLGIPTVASVYKILRLIVQRREREQDALKESPSN